MKEEEFIALANKISDGTASSREIALYNAYYNYLQQEESGDASLIDKEKFLKAELKNRIDQQLGLSSKTSQKRQPIYRWMAAASVLLLMSVAAYFYLSNSPQPRIAIDSKRPVEIVPGSNKAVLTLADGTQIVLNDEKNGLLTHQGNVAINKAADGRLVYQAGQPSSDVALQNQATVYNTITIPRGGQYQLDLPDGTRVWLNSSTQLRYPAAFTGKERIVQLRGEAYFEVAHVEESGSNNKARTAMPFKVIVNGREEVQVLGTHFNIMAYPDEAASRTTLLEGAVKVRKGNASRIMKPGQQALIENENIQISAADIEEAVAWKNGQILFKEQDLKTIMRQVSRWYDVDIIYKGNEPERLFTGGISRKSNLSSLLKILELSNIHFTIKERTITITP